ncbi:MAG: endonuclease/exonuclease/phosphatase family protein [Bacteroidales bacterium]|nr:endonuclease/exonuclease/phosphatase family protein [Bacteroidales bacterium]
MKNTRPVGFIGYLLRFINFLIMAGLLLAYTAKFISPDLFWIPAFFGLAYPYLLIINILFIFYWVFRWRLFLIWPVLILAIGFNLPRYYVGFGSNVEYSGEHKSVKLMSFNVHDFDFYTQTYGSNGEAFDRISDFIAEQNPDIICFQEFYSYDLKISHSTFIKLKAKGYLFGYRKLYNEKSKKMYLVILSKYPIFNSGYLDIAEGNDHISGVYADVSIKGTKVRVYDLHLATMGVSSESKYITKNYDLSNEQDIHKAATGAKRISSRIKNGFIRRSKQAEQVQKHIELCPYPVLLAGDFNDSPCSYSYSLLSKDMKDAFVEVGKGFSNTYNGKVPSYRIDYILFDKHFEALSYQRHKIKASDHYPVVAELVIKETTDE